MTVTDRINGLNQGVAYKAPVRVATTANITLSGEQTIDGIAVVANDRVLVKDQTDAKENGIYIASASAWARSADFDGSRDVTEGTLFMVLYGSTSAGFLYKLTTTTDPVDFGVDDITFSIALDLSAISSITAFGLSFIAAANAEAGRTLLELKKNNYTATAAPTTGDDSSKGYSVGSQWYDQTNDNMYHCVDSTVGAAVWVQGDVVAADLGSAALANLIDDDTFATATSSNVPSAESVLALVNNQTKGTKVTQSTGTSLPALAWTALAFDSEEYDDGGWHDNATNNTRITVDGAGRYVLDANVEINTTANGDIGMRFKVNGTVIKSEIIDSGTVPENAKYGLSAVVNLAANDYVEVEVYNDSGTLTSQTAGTYFAAQRVRLS